MRFHQLRRFYDALDAWTRGAGPLTDASALYASDMATLPRVLLLVGACDINNYPSYGLTTHDIINLMLLYQIGLLNHRTRLINKHLHLDSPWNPATDENTI